MPSSFFEHLNSGGRSPTPPAVVVRLLELTRRQDATTKEVADTIALDPNLSAKILRFVNSPMAGLQRQVTSIQQAVSLLGMRGVKLMALSFAIVSSAKDTKTRGFDASVFALQSVACGVAARILANATNATNAQEAFSAALLSQMGRSILASSFPIEYAVVLAKASRAPIDLPELERAAFGETYATVGAYVLLQWGLPEPLCLAVRAFRDVDARSDAPPLAKILEVAELAAAFICPARKDQPLDARPVLDACKRRFAISEEKSQAALAEMCNEVDALRTLMELPAGTLRSSEQIEGEVRERIAELSLALHIENQNMAEQQEDLMRRATTDPLTGVGNRAAFDARLALEFERSARAGQAFSLLMIDVDKFKNLNDTYGHVAGDRVLQNLAKILEAEVRRVDYVARFGGEEFAVILPGLSAPGASQIAERLRVAVQGMEVRWEGRNLKATISVGVAVFDQAGGTDRAARLVQTADERLYAAKAGGRNRVEFAERAGVASTAPSVSRRSRVRTRVRSGHGPSTRRS